MGNSVNILIQGLIISLFFILHQTIVIPVSPFVLFPILCLITGLVANLFSYLLTGPGLELIPLRIVAARGS